MTKTEPRIQDALVIKLKGVRSGEVFRLIIDDFFAKAANWSGDTTCVPVFQLSFIRPGEYEDVVWAGTFIPNDTASIEELLLGMDEVESIQHRRNFQPNAKPVRKAKRKKEPKGPFSKHGFDLDRWSECYHKYFDRPELTVESQALRELLDGYPFENKSPVENARFIEIEVIHRLRDRFPTMYELNAINRNELVEALTLMSKPEIQLHGEKEDFQVWGFFGENVPPSQIGVFLSRLKWLDCKIRTGRLKEFRNRKFVDPTDDDAAEDKLFHIVGTGRGVMSDRSHLDDEIDEEEFMAATECSLVAITEGEAEAMASGAGALTSFG